MSLQGGQYPSPLVRPTFVTAPVVAGYTTVRLWANLQFSGTGTSPSLNDNLVMATVENVGDADMTMQFRQVGDYSSGLPFRSNLGTAIALKAGGGRKQVTFTPTQQYLEVWGVSGGSQLRMQLQSQLQFNELGFARGDTTYPPQLWQPPNYNT